MNQPILTNKEDQFKTIMAAPGGTTANFSWTIQDGVKIGSICISTNSAYDGTTGTAVLQACNDNTNWAGVLQDDNSTAMSFTLATASTYTWELKSVSRKYYRIVYTKGNATDGTITADFIGKK